MKTRKLLALSVLTVMAIALGACSNLPLLDNQPPVAKIRYGILSEGSQAAAQLDAPLTEIESVEQFPSVKAPAILLFDATASYDPDGDIVAYDWTIKPGKAFSLPRFNYVFATPGIYRVTLKVTDDKGAVGSASTLVTVRNLFEEEPGVPDETLQITRASVFSPEQAKGWVEFYIAHPTAVRRGQEFTVKIVTVAKRELLASGWQGHVSQGLKLVRGKLKGFAVQPKANQEDETVIVVKATGTGTQVIAAGLQFAVDPSKSGRTFVLSQIKVLP